MSDIGKSSIACQLASIRFHCLAFLEMLLSAPNRTRTCTCRPSSWFRAFIDFAECQWNYFPIRANCYSLQSGCRIAPNVTASLIERSSGETNRSFKFLPAQSVIPPSRAWRHYNLAQPSRFTRIIAFAHGSLCIKQVLPFIRSITYDCLAMLFCRC